MNLLGRAVAIVLFGLAAAGFFLSSRDALIRTGTGDEPHYLIAADAMAHFGGPELSAAYRTGTLARSLLPASYLDFSTETLNEVRGSFSPFESVGAGHGLYSVHTIGLPLLMVPILKKAYPFRSGDHHP